MKIFKTFKNTFANKQFYADVITGNEKSGFGYAYLLNLIIWLLVSIYLIIILAIAMPAFRTIVSDEFPANLTLTIKAGQVSVNQPEPHVIAIPAKYYQKSMPENLVVIDTKTPFTPDQFTTYKTDFIIKKDSLAVQRDTGEIRLIPAKNFPDAVISRESVNELIGNIAPFGFILPIIFLVIMVSIYFGLKLLGYLVIALLAWAMFAIMGKKPKFRNIYSAVLFAGTIPAILAVTPFIIPSLSFVDSYWLTTIIILGVIYFNTRGAVIPPTASEEELVVVPEPVVAPSEPTPPTTPAAPTV